MAEYVFLGAVLVGALYLFWTRRLRTDITAVLVMLSLIVPWPHPDGEWRAVLTYQEGFAGFGSAAVIMVAAMFVIGAAIVQTGAAEALGMRLLRRTADHEWQLQLAILCASTLASMFINDTTVVLVFLPLIMSICRERNLSPSRYLLFAAYGSLLGGQWTLIGTRSNIILNDFLRLRSDESIAFFDFTPVAAPVFVLAAAFLLLVGRRWLPDLAPARRRDMREFVTEAVVPKESQAVGSTLSELELPGGEDVTVVGLLRRRQRVPAHWRLKARDHLILRGTKDTIADFLKSAHFKVSGEAKLDPDTLESVDLVTVEALVPAGSILAGQTVRQVAFRRRYGVTVVGMARHGQPMSNRLMHTPLQPGDALLFLGGADDMARLRENANLVFLEEETFPPFGRRKAWIMAGLLGGVIVLSVTGLLAPAISIPLAAALAVLLGCISLRLTYASIDWPTLVTLAGLIPFGIAIEKTGAAAVIATLAVDTFSGMGPIFLLGCLLLIALLFTQVIENAAVAIIVAPIAFEMAAAMQMNPKSVMIGLGVAVSAGFMTPVAHESTILVMGPGQYEFKHYLTLGSVLALCTWLVATLLTPLVWPLG